MLVELSFARSLTLLDGEATGVDKYGNDTQSWPAVTVDGCTWWPSSTTEAQPVGADTTTDRLGVLLPETARHASGRPPSAADRAVLPGQDGVWQFDGTPRQHVSPITGTQGGLYGWLVRVTG